MEINNNNQKQDVRKEMSLVAKACEMALKDKISNVNDLKDYCKKHPVTNEFLNEIYDTIIDLFVDEDIYQNNESDLENSDGYLSVYLAYKLLSTCFDLNRIIDFYLDVINKKVLTKAEVDRLFLDFYNSNK